MNRFLVKRSGLFHEMWVILDRERERLAPSHGRRHWGSQHEAMTAARHLAKVMSAKAAERDE